MGKKWKTVHKSEEDFLKQKNQEEEFIYGKRNVKGKQADFPAHLHLGKDFLTITTEWDKSLSHRTPYNSIESGEKLGKKLESNGINTNCESCEPITPILSLEEALSGKKISSKGLVSFIKKQKISAQEFLKKEYLVGVIGILKKKPRFVINEEGVLKELLFKELLGCLPEIEKTYKNRKKIAKKMRQGH